MDQDYDKPKVEGTWDWKGYVELQTKKVRGKRK